MLDYLIVRNFAIIRSIELGFGDNLNIITGETGAGKSILIDALGLILGDRAVTEMVGRWDSKIVIEASFSLQGDTSFIDEIGLNSEDGQLIIRREVSQDGKSRCFVNDTQATLKTLRFLGARLVEFHGQHEHQILLNPDSHIDFLDGFGKLFELRLEVETAYRKLTEVSAKLKTLRESIKTLQQQRELALFQLDEINSANLVAGEEEELQDERNRLAHAMALKEHCYQIYEALSQEGFSALSVIGSIKDIIEQAVKLDRTLSGKADTINDMIYRTEDLADFFRNYLELIEEDPERLAWIEERLATIDLLKRKYGGSIKAVLELQEKLHREFAGEESLEDTEAMLLKECASLQEDLYQKALYLSEKRAESAKKLESSIMKEINSIGMEKSRFQIKIERSDVKQTGDEYEMSTSIGPCGMDHVEFLISTNPGEEMKPLVRVVSGGEMSRIMLALKTTLAHVDRVNTLIFDEIDIGLSGRIADAVGRRLASLAENRQVIVITHLPQIARLNGRHLRVVKEQRKDETVTRVEHIEGDEREKELAKLLSGKYLTETALSHAREMLQTANMSTEDN